MSNLDLSQDTIRQRRNLLFTSALLIFEDLADIKFGDKVTFLGATLEIGNPDAIHQGLLILLAYFLWRFYQYFTTDKAYYVLRNQFADHMKRNTSLILVRAICKFRKCSNLSGEYLYKNLKRGGAWVYQIEAKEPTGLNLYGEEDHKTFVAKFSIIKIEFYRLLTALGFVFKARILTDYFVPYILFVYATYLQF